MAERVTYDQLVTADDPGTVDVGAGCSDLISLLAPASAEYGLGMRILPAGWRLQEVSYDVAGGTESYTRVVAPNGQIWDMRQCGGGTSVSASPIGTVILLGGAALLVWLWMRKNK